ncbi:MAG: ComF family protein, partial [Mycobacteriales bacterium]
FGGPRPHLPVPCPRGMPPTWAGGRYAGSARAALLAYKERGRRDLAPYLATALAGVVRTALGADTAGVAVLLVPVPSRGRAARARGGDHMGRLARLAAHRLQPALPGIRVAGLLRIRGRPRDAAGLDARQRAANVRGVFVVDRRAAPTGRPADVVLLLDDVLTTGATLAEATRTLGVASIPVRCAAVLAATLRRSAPGLSEPARLG